MSSTSSSKKRSLSSKKTPTPKHVHKSSKNSRKVVQSDSEDDNYKNDNDNDNDNDDGDYEDHDDDDEEDKPANNIPSQIGTQDLLDYPNLHPEFRDGGMYHVIHNMKKVNRGVVTLPEHSSPFLRCLEAYKEDNDKEFIDQLFAWISVICLDRVHTAGILKGKDILIAMGGYVPNILQQLPMMEYYKATVFDHFIDYANTEASGTWPFALITLVESYSSSTLSKTIAKRFPTNTPYDLDIIKRLNLGWHLKKVADETRKYVVDFYNKMWVQPGDLPSGYETSQLIEAMRLEMIPIVLHRKALSNCGRYATNKLERSVNLDRMYNNAITTFNKKVFVPPGWIAWILGGIPIGEEKALKVLLVGMETNRRSAAFSSRASRRAERMANAQIGRAGTSASVVHEQDVETVQSNTVDPKDTEPERIIHEHLLRMSINVPLQDKRLKYLEKKMKNQQEMLNNYILLGWNVSKNQKYNELMMNQMECQETYNKLLDSCLLDADVDENQHHNEPDASDELTTSTTRDVNQIIADLEVDDPTQLDPTAPTQLDPTAPIQLDHNSSTSIKSYVSKEQLDECIRLQGMQQFNKKYDSSKGAFLATTTIYPDLQCSVLHCINEIYDVCSICANNLTSSTPKRNDFCVEHFYHCYHENDYLKR